MTIGKFGRSLGRSLGRSEKVDVLSALPLFAASSRRELADVAEITVEAVHPPGTVLTREGQAGGLAFVVMEGTAEVVRDDRVLGTLAPGDMAGELSLIDGRPRSATVRTTSEVRVLEINGDDFAALLDRAPQFTRNLLRSLSLRLREMDDRWAAGS